MKKIVLLSHCVLNSFCETPEASDRFRRELVNMLMERGISMVQLPCPELCFQALERESILPDGPQAESYGRYCRELLAPMVKNLKEYQSHGIQIAGIIGIDTSPSCSVLDKSAIMTKLLLEEMEGLGIVDVKLLDMPVEGDGKAFFQQAAQL